ncbi:MAG TPA: response regulator [Nitrososphaeraceae archaeon]|nr:response regulator [Nitrososphaeraceae archaeon]
MVISNNKVKKILLVDDEPDITFTIKSMLNDNGFQIYTFNDPITPLKLYRSNFYDLVILDIKMPKMDGFELYNKIREKDPKVKICFLTAIATVDQEFRKARSEVGRIIAEECFIQKPITTEDLIRKLIDIMNIDMITMSI